MMMIQKIRSSKITKVVASYLAIQILLQLSQPAQLWALTSGPSQPEFNSFTPIGTSDMVNLSSGDFNYNIPIMDVGGYPLNLAYDSGVTMDQEASWVGLGWNLNVGQIARNVRGLPDDFKGDGVRYENNMKTNKTYGANFGIGGYVFGSGLGVNGGLGIQYNNYNGISFKPSLGMSFNVHDNVSLGFNVSGSDTDGVNVNPSLNLHSKKDKTNKNDFNVGASLGVSYNTRQGLTSMSLSATSSRAYKDKKKVENPNSIGISGARSFVNSTYTPTKRTAYANYNGSIKGAVGGEIFGAEVQGDLQGYASYQKIREEEKDKIERAFGYEHTEKASITDILDFNREKDRSVNEATQVLPVTNYTYDLYAIQGQGIAGQFRPFRSQVGFVFDQYVADFGGGGDLAAEFGAGNLVHAGVDARTNISSSSTGIWQSRNNALSHLVEKTKNNQPDYQKVYFKRVGEMNIDKDITERTLFSTDVGAYQPIRVGLAGSGGSFSARNQYEAKNYANGSAVAPLTTSLSGPLKRENRILTSDAIGKVTVEEINNYGTVYDKSLLSRFAGSGDNLKKHHTGAINVLQKDGSRYIYGKAAYNSKKIEASFNVSGILPSCSEASYGLVSYEPGVNNSNRNNRGNEYFNRITTPSYAHTYLLSSVLSNDYEDLTNDGPTDDDLGAYTKFTYRNYEPNGGVYKWRIPFQENTASFNEGLKSDLTDDIGNYVYGEKELLYAQTIETKTHIAVFYLSPRKDGFGVKSENGGLDFDAPMQKLDRIALYSKPEYKEQGDNAEPIKVAHFEYNYELCPNIQNHRDYNKSTKTGPGKLTLDKVYFTYRDSDMGRYTPYTFSYSDFNPTYNIKNYDVWGNYKEGASGCGLNDPLAVSEFPYVKQDKTVQDRNVTAWTLQSIGLPSGGRIDLETESDDYQYVQNKNTMRMFKVVGAGISKDTNNIFRTYLYDTSLPSPLVTHLFIEVDDPSITDTPELKSKMIDPIIDQPIYFRFLLNIRKEGALGTQISNNASFDYVTGYVFLDNDSSKYKVFDEAGKTYAAIPIQTTTIEGGTAINPIAKAGFNYARKYLNNIAYSSVNNKGVNSDKPLDVLNKILGSFDAVFRMFRGPNEELRQESCARRFVGGKSWIRLQNPSTNKLGGGSRIKSIQMYDQWDAMTNNIDNPIYKQRYGQEYSYVLENETSSGVATYEPLISKENPFVEPIFENNAKGKLLAPEEDNYVEKPFGESFFPSPTVTYSRTLVKNLSRRQLDDNGNIIKEVKKHATGHVVHEFYTTQDYPTLVDFTPIDTRRKTPDFIKNPFYIDERQEMAMSQGFTIHTNDMNGKMKSQKVFAEGQKGAISGVEYVYRELNPEVSATSPIRGKLNNIVPTIDKKGNIADKLIGIEFDVVNDFRQNSSSYESVGVNFNIGSFLAAIIPVIVPMPLPEIAKHSDDMKSSSTTKVIHSSGILKEKIAFDLGSRVSTKNLAYDANTGEVLLTETVNEYGDQYYNLNYPAYWAYKGMGQASINLGLEWGYEKEGNHFALVQNSRVKGNEYAADLLINGDEITTQYQATKLLNVNGAPVPVKVPQSSKLWVHQVGYNGPNSFRLMDIKGTFINPSDIEGVNGEPLVLKVIRSGYRNQQGASMASITLMKNPLTLAATNNNVLPNFESDNWNDYRIVNTSAVEYSDLWATQCEADLPVFELPEDIPFKDQDSYTDVICFNPYVNNVRAEWRAKKSYAYRTGRKASETPKLRKDGYYVDYKPLYTLTTENDMPWELNETNRFRWTFASAVTQYSPFGAELENRDALRRYSSAQYGYNYTLPTAVSSNSKYRSMGFDGFEDYAGAQNTKDHFSFKDEVSNNPAAYSKTTSHTGTASIAVAPGGKTTLSTRLVPCPNGDPEAVDDQAAATVGQTVTIPVTLNDNFGPNGPSDQAISITVPPKYGTATVDDNGTPNDPTDDVIVYTATSLPNTTTPVPKSGDTSTEGDEGGGGIPIAGGPEYLLYEICDSSCTADGKGDCDDARVDIEVIADSKPIAVDDSIVIDSNETKPINVLANDTFSQNGPSNPFMTIVSVPTYGTASINNNNTNDNLLDDYIEYTAPNSNAWSTDAITYQICDTDGDCDTADINISNGNTVKLANYEVLRDYSNIRFSIDVVNGTPGEIVTIKPYNYNGEDFTFELLYRFDASGDLFDPDLPGYAYVDGSRQFNVQLDSNGERKMFFWTRGVYFDGACDQRKMSFSITGTTNSPINPENRIEVDRPCSG